MTGVIIAGGLGTRLRPLTDHRPKHLLPLANRPFLEFQIDLLRRHGIRKVVFATSYLAEMIEAHFGDGGAFGVDLEYALEDVPLGTAGAIRNAAGFVPPGPLLVLNGDILTDFDLSSLIEFHNGRHSDATIALRPVERPHAFGVLTTLEDGRVTAWNEPTEAEKRAVAENPGPPTGQFDAINAGIYLLEPHIVERIPPDRPVSIERETFPHLISSGARVFGTAPEGYWADIGRAEQCLAANAAVLEGRVQSGVAFRAVAAGASVAADAVIDSCTSIAPGSTVGAGSRLDGCIILGNVRIGSGARLTHVIADDNSSVEDGAIGEGLVLGSGNTLRRSS